MKEIDIDVNAAVANESENPMPRQEMKIVEALDSIIGVGFHTALDHEVLSKADEAFDFLTTKLSITRIQALIIGMLIDSDETLHTKNMACYLGISNIKFLKYTDELEDLVNRKILRKVMERGDKIPSYEIRQEALQQYMHNMVYDAPEFSHLSLSDFITRCNQWFEACTDECMSKVDLQNDIEELLQQNQQLFICKVLNGLHIFEKIFFLYCAVKYVLENDCAISTLEISEYSNPLACRRMNSLLESGKSELRVQNLVQPSGANGFTSKESYTVSDEIRNQLNESLGIAVGNSEDEMAKGLLRCDCITPKALFYNENERKSLTELGEILSQERFADVQQRLENNGMRKGFACLFYGAPGTGKTESVLQLARTTGRHIMEVNIASIKSKWVGDSEKNIKNVFQRYRHYCSTCSTLPILLFNEADAIISKRGANVERSVDKMENAIQNIILEEMEKLDGILIATTNLTCNMDSAFERRFLYKIEFHKPNVEAKIQIWKSMLHDLSDQDARTLSEAYDFSGGQIENVTRKVIINNILHNEPITLSKVRSYCDSEFLNHQHNTRMKIGFC